MHGFEVATRVRGAVVAVVAVLVSLVAVGSARAALVCAPNVAVDASCSSSAAAIQSAIDAASASDTVLVGPGAACQGNCNPPGGGPEECTCGIV